MRKSLKLCIALVIFLMASSSFASSASAATNTIITQQNGAPVITTTGTLFNIPNLNPGDHYSTTITFQNQTAEGLSLTLKDMGQTFDRSDLSGLTFTLRDSSGNFIAESSNLYDLFNIALNTIPPHSTLTFIIELSVSAALGNAYQGATNTHYANFTISGDFADSTDHSKKVASTAPNTGLASLLGDHIDSLGIFLAAILATLIGLIIIAIKRKRQNAQAQS